MSSSLVATDTPRTESRYLVALIPGHWCSRSRLAFVPFGVCARPGLRRPGVITASGDPIDLRDESLQSQLILSITRQIGYGGLDCDKASMSRTLLSSSVVGQNHRSITDSSSSPSC